MTRTSFPLAATALLLFAAAATAQQKICLSVHGGPATGRTKAGTWPSTIRATIKVGGHIDGTGTDIPSDVTADWVSAVHQAEFDSKHYRTCRTNANEFCILAGPGGAPLQTDDYGYQTTDTGLRTDVRIEALSDASGGGCPGPGGTISPDTKGHGLGIAVPDDAQQPLPMLPRPVRLEFLFEVRQGNVNSAVSAVAQVSTAFSGQQIRLAIQQALEQAGLHWTAARWRSIEAPELLQEGLLIDRSVTGGTVHHVEYRSDLLSHLLMPMAVVAGTVPAYGTTEYGQPTRGNANSTPYAVIDVSPRLGGSFQLEYHTGLVNAPGGEMMSIGRAAQALPLLNGWLLVDPGTAVFQFRISDGAGVMRCAHDVPATAGLLGLPLAFQGGAHDASFTLSLTTGVAATVMQ